MGIMPVTGIPLPVHVLRRLVDAHRVRRHRPRPQRPHAPLPLTAAPAVQRGESADACPVARARHDLWPQLEPLLAKVQKPARYIGGETGRSGPARPRPASPGCSATPTPTRSGCPTRACRSSTRSSTSVPTRWPSGPMPRGPTSRSCPGRACRCSRSTPTARPATSTCWRSTSRPSSSTRTSSTASTSPACRCGRPSATGEHPLGRRRRALHLQPRAARRLRRRLRARRRGRGRRRDHRGGRGVERRGGPRPRRASARLAAVPGVYVPGHVRRRLRRGRPRG